MLWAEGEPLLLVGPDGVGKTTVAQQLMLCRAGVHADDLLGFTVTADTRPILYVAADRPAQAARSLRRMVGEEDREALVARLTVWLGPPPHDLGREPEAFANWVLALNVGTVVLDGLKDVALDLSTDEVGSRVARGFQMLVAGDVEVLALHHQRKRAQSGGAPRKIDDVYGSRWITAACGSVVMVWGKPGDSEVTIKHLKQPAAVVGPLTIRHDHAAGHSTLVTNGEGDDLAETVTEVVAWIEARPGEITGVVKEAIRKRPETVVAALVEAEKQGLIRHEAGNRTAKLWYPNRVVPYGGGTPGTSGNGSPAVPFPTSRSEAPFRASGTARTAPLPGNGCSPRNDSERLGGG